MICCFQVYDEVDEAFDKTFAVLAIASMRGRNFGERSMCEDSLNNMLNQSTQRSKEGFPL